MSFCRVNGVVVPVVANEAGEEPLLVETASRMEDASMLIDRRAEKGMWRLRVVHQLATAAHAFRRLLHGDFHYWSFDNVTTTTRGLYSARGLGPDAATGCTCTAGSAWLGAAKCVITLGNRIDYTIGPCPAGMTVMAAENIDGAGWNHKIKDSAGNVWTNGVLTGAWPNITTLTAATGFFRIGTGAAAASYLLDEVIALPFLLPSDWPAQVYAFMNPASGNTQWPFAPRALKLDGDIVDNGVTRTVVARVGSVGVKHTKTAGVKTPKRTFEALIEEV